MNDGRESSGADGSAKAAREERLARALRDNLRRRKAQARGDRRDPALTDAAMGDDASSDETGRSRCGNT